MRVLLSFMLLIGLSGCTSNVVMSGRQVSNIDPDAIITPESRIKVETMEVGDPLTNKRYIENVIQAFHSRGYHNIGANLTKPDVIARFSLTNQQQVKKVEQPIYRERVTGHTTSCYSTGADKHRCDTNVYTMPHLVGYETLEQSVLEAKMTLKLIDTQNHLLLQSTSFVTHPTCSRWKLYEFLVQHSIAQLDFKHPMDKPFNVEMPEDYQCTDGN